MDEQITKMCSTHKMECYAALKNKGILAYATSWMIFVDILISEINQWQKEKYSIIPLLYI